MRLLAEADPSALWDSFSRAWESWITIVFVAIVGVMWAVAIVVLVRAKRIGRLLKVEAGTALESHLEGRGLHALSSALQQFREHLVNDQQQRHESSRHYLTDEALQSDIRLGSWGWLRGITWRALDEIPSWFVGVGILGTFVGVSLALGALNTDDIEGSLPNTIRGLATAFWVSIFAVLSSLVLQWITRLVENGLDQGMRALVERVDQQFAAGKRDELGRQHLEIGRKQLDVKAELRDLQRRQNELAETTNATLSQIKAETEQSRASLQQLLEDLSERFENSLNMTFTNHLVTPLSDMVNAVKGSAAQASAVSQDSAKQFTQEAMKQLGGGLQEYFAGLGNSIQTFAAQFNGVTSQLESSMAETKNLVGQQSALLASTLTTADRLRGDQVQAMAALNIVPQMVEQIAVLSQQIGATLSHTGGIQERQAALHEQVKVDVDQAATLFQSSAASLAHVLAPLAPAVSEVGATMRALNEQAASATQRMQDVEANLGKHLAQAAEIFFGQSKIAQQYVAALKEGRKVIDDLGGLSNAMVQAADQLAGTTEPLGLAADKLGLVAGQLETGANTLDGVTNALGEVAGETQAWAEQSTQAINAFQVGLTTTLGTTLKRYDESLQTAITNLQATIEDLDDKASQVADSAANVARATERRSNP